MCLLEQKVQKAFQTYQTYRFENFGVNQTQIPSLPSLPFSELVPIKQHPPNVGDFSNSSTFIGTPGSCLKETKENQTETTTVSLI